MAAYEVLEQWPETAGVTYLMVRVSFLDQQFDQQLVSALDGVELAAELQSYADDYMAGWQALPIQEKELI